MSIKNDSKKMIEQLQAHINLINEDRANWCNDHAELQLKNQELDEKLNKQQDWYAKYLEIKQHYEDLKTNYQRLEETYTRSRKRKEELEDQLQDCVSKADHEAIVNKWREDFSGAFNRSQKHADQARKYREWWESEYIKNIEVGR